MTEAEKRREGYRKAAAILADELFLHNDAEHAETDKCACPEWREVARIRDDLARAGAVKDDLPAR